MKGLGETNWLIPFWVTSLPVLFNFAEINANDVKWRIWRWRRVPWSYCFMTVTQVVEFFAEQVSQREWCHFVATKWHHCLCDACSAKNSTPNVINQMNFLILLPSWAFCALQMFCHLGHLWGMRWFLAGCLLALLDQSFFCQLIKNKWITVSWLNKWAFGFAQCIVHQLHNSQIATVSLLDRYR